MVGLAGGHLLSPNGTDAETALNALAQGWTAPSEGRSMPSQAIKRQGSEWEVTLDREKVLAARTQLHATVLK